MCPRRRAVGTGLRAGRRRTRASRVARPARYRPPASGKLVTSTATWRTRLIVPPAAPHGRLRGLAVTASNPARWRSAAMYDAGVHRVRLPGRTFVHVARPELARTVPLDSAPAFGRSFVAQRVLLHRRAVHEAMRPYPPIAAIVRTVLRPVRVGPHAPEPGDRVTVAPMPMHRNPAWWPDPHAFEESRFAPEAVAARDRFAYLPFGDGPDPGSGHAADRPFSRPFGHGGAAARLPAHGAHRIDVMTRTRIRFPDPLYRRLEQVAETNGRSLAEVVRRASELCVERFSVEADASTPWRFPVADMGGDFLMDPADVRSESDASEARFR